MSKYCSKCGQEIMNNDKCPRCGHKNESSNGDFNTSVVAGYVTNSTVLGALIGGDILGAAIGDFLNDD